MEKKVSSRQVYKGRVVSLRVDQVETPSGRLTSREIVDRPDTVSILAIDDQERVLLVRQFRYAAGAESLEIPCRPYGPGQGKGLTQERRRTSG